ncbi:MAG TPA: helicase HerA-like domain-containing protein [Candidatus Limnocylindria bacterium]|nr:helicase HerA-like domain-containing protein [Candidatus Limnocylindria bacterium]
MADEQFEQAIAAGYGFEGPSLTFGAAQHEDRTIPAAQVRIPLGMLNRHGLVAGATGTGKTKTLQVLAEQLSDAGVPVFISDIKGDISGLGAPAELNDRITDRAEQIGFTDYAPRAFPVEFLTLDRDGKGVRLRASVLSFGPILLAKVLDLNETQQSVLALAFKYADDHTLPLIDLADLRALLNHLDSEDGKKEMEEYGGVATATVGVIIRKIVELEQQEADAFFGAPEFDVADFLRTTPDGKGVISVLELADMQDRPALFSTFMMWLLAKLYQSLPEVGDPERPKLVFFFDEAHLLFRDANKTFLQQIELVARLIRSKGVGVFFVTHSPADVEASVLAQLGNRVQHALRAFTPDDLEVVRATAETFPVTEFYEVDTELTRLGTGEALVTALDPKGRPMPTVRVMMRPPQSLMAQLEPAAFDAVVAASPIAAEYAADQDPQSAREMLAARVAELEKAAADAETPLDEVRDPAGRGRMRPTRAPERGVDWRDVAQEGARFARSGTFNTILRSILGVLGGGSRRR